ncbi:hypothetical protein CROQUDRAFT_37937 [Cronartium quercuum f. sp. fusiforme G11]|uniref:FHA domain-containing protein n=1 Tax=Cronartium quercuum f. sp. fusiforme G11 TaxID=708437 RepID=A0A9P6NUS7_9BASI|nr:hypothetical protein CROQUDRAFT_37937 [Cronartium quercuum f. sp. fusiforme G11]
MQFQPLPHSLIPSPLLTSSSSNSTTTNDTFHQHVQPQPSAASIHLSSLATAQQPTLNRSTQHISPRLDALAYVSTVELPKLSLAPLLPPEPEEEDESGRVRAYAKLEFPQHDFFIRKLTVTIGRRPPARPDACNEEEEDPIDVDLGPIRAVSRRHARIYFDWARGRWTLSVAGRNGCVVDGRWRARGEVLALGAR